MTVPQRTNVDNNFPLCFNHFMISDLALWTSGCELENVSPVLGTYLQLGNHGEQWGIHPRVSLLPLVGVLGDRGGRRKYEIF